MPDICRAQEGTRCSHSTVCRDLESLPWTETRPLLPALCRRQQLSLQQIICHPLLMPQSPSCPQTASLHNTPVKIKVQESPKCWWGHPWRAHTVRILVFNSWFSSWRQLPRQQVWFSGSELSGQQSPAIPGTCWTAKPAGWHARPHPKLQVKRVKSSTGVCGKREWLCTCPPQKSWVQLLHTEKKKVFHN